MPGKRQSGFTLVEMLMALVLIALLALSAHTLIRLSYSQLKHLTQPAMQLDEGLFLTFQWIENDLLQSRRDLPWHMDGSLDADSCVVSWTFETENFPVFDKTDALTRPVRYRVANQMLIREVLNKDVVLSSRRLLDGVTCLHADFWQKGRWNGKPLPNARIAALSLTLRWKGPTVIRLWAVDMAP